MVTYLDGSHIFTASLHQARLLNLKLTLAPLQRLSIMLQFTKVSLKALALFVRLLQFISQGVGRLIQLYSIAHQLLHVVIKRFQELLGNL